MSLIPTPSSNSDNRIHNGLCSSDSNPRLTSNHRSGKGDDGYSQLMNGIRIPKNHEACNFYGAVEELQQAISECLFYNSDNIYSSDTVYVLKWLFRNLFSLSSFVFLKADTSRHQFPDSFLSYIESQCSLLSSQIGSAPDFLSYTHISLLHFNKIRIAVRKLESCYVAWRRSDEMVRHQLSHPELINVIAYHSAILNRLSSYLFWITRKQSQFLSSQGLSLEEQYWQSEIESFNI